MKNFRKTSLLILLTTVAIFASATAYAQLEANDRKWLKLIRTDHPRLFLTAEDIPLIISNATSSTLFRWAMRSWPSCQKQSAKIKRSAPTYRSNTRVASTTFYSTRQSRMVVK